MSAVNIISIWSRRFFEYPFQFIYHVKIVKQKVFSYTGLEQPSDSDSPPSKVCKLSRTDTHCIEEIIKENTLLKLKNAKLKKK